MSFSSFDFLSTLLHWGIGGTLLVLCVAFVRSFLWPGRRIGKELRQAHARLAALKAEAAGGIIDLSRVATEVMQGGGLEHCWQEYRHTVHEQTRDDGTGSVVVVRQRATAMANAFFTEHSLVGTRLHTEFFKHLPGILTGLGIIGTFSGLILGLKGFEVTDDAAVVRNSLATLIQSVGGAFVVSGVAIFFAMLVTFAEKLVINRRYAEIDRLCSLIDSLFDAGAGEEYLKRLVEASETSATQAMQMKESLVTDLKQVLEEMTQRQVAAMTATSTQLGSQITASLSEGLKEPLDRISNAVQTVGGNQGEAVNKLLTDVLSSFSERMEQMFGSQMRGMNEVLQQTAQSIQATASRFDQLAERVEQAGSGAAESMAKRMEDLMASMNARQSEANAQMAAFIDGIKQSIAHGQGETASALESMLARLGEGMDAMVRRLQAQAEADAASSAARQAEAAEQMRRSMQELADSMKAVVHELQKAARDAAGETQSSQKELAQQMRSSMQEMADGMRALVLEMQAAVAANAGETRAGQQALAEQIGHMVQELGMGMQALLEQLKAETASSVGGVRESQQQVVEQMRQMVQELADSTRSLVLQLQDETGKAVGGAGKQLQEQAAGMRAMVQELGDSMKELVQRLGAQVIEQGDHNKAGQQELADGVKALLQQLQGVVAETGAGNRAGVEALAQHMRDTVAALATDMKALVQQLQAAARDDTERSGVERQRSAEAIQRLLSDLSLRIGELVERLKEQIAAAGRQNQEGHAELAKLYATWAQAQKQDIERLTGAVSSASQGMRDAVDKLQVGASSSIERMNTGAEKLQGAAERLGDGLDSIRSATAGLDTTAHRFVQAGEGLGQALGATQQVLADQRQVRDALAAMVADLNATVDNAKREASLTRDLVEGLGVASQRLVDAQRTAENYLDGVSDVLAQAHTEFAANLTNTLRTGNAQFHQELSQAVNLLKGSIQELGDALEQLPSAA